MDRIFLVILITSLVFAVVSFLYILMNYRNPDTDAEVVTVKTRENRESYERKVDVLFSNLEFIKKKEHYHKKTGTDR